MVVIALLPGGLTSLFRTVRDSRFGTALSRRKPATPVPGTEGTAAAETAAKEDA